MLPFGNIPERIFTHTASHYACKHTTILAVWQGRKCRLRAAEPHPPFSFPRKKTGGVTVQKKGVCIVCLPLNILFACGLHCLPSVVSKRLGLLLSPLSLCLRIGSLHQFPSISDILLYFIIVDRSVSFQQIQVYMQSFSASLVLHTVFCLSADQFVQ